MIIIRTLTTLMLRSCDAVGGPEAVRRSESFDSLSPSQLTGGDLRALPSGVRHCV
jgi:hypothetical protein